MFSMKLIWKSILYSKVRNVIVIMITALVFCLIILSLCIYRESQRQIDYINQDYGGSLTVTRYLIGASPNIINNPPQLKLEECLAFKEFDYVDDVQVFSYNYCASKDDSTLLLNGRDLSWTGWNLFVVGYNMDENNVFTDANETDYIEGRCFTSAAECVVSNLTAVQYGLKVGDTIEVRNNSSGISVKLALVGIISNTVLESRYSDQSYKNNFIFTTMSETAIFNELKRQRNLYNTSLPYYDGYNFIITLDSYKNYNAFQRILMSTRTTIDGYEYGFFADYAKGGYTELIRPLNDITNQFYVLTLLLIIMFLTMVSITTIISIKTMKYRFGILRSMGMKKINIFYEFCTEQSILYISSIILGSILGVALLTVISSWGIIGIQIIITKTVIYDILTIGLYSLGIVIVIILGSLLYILKFNPLKILRN